MIPTIEKVYAVTSLKDAVELMGEFKFAPIPVVRSPEDDRATGVLDSRRVKKLIDEEVFRRRNQILNGE